MSVQQSNPSLAMPPPSPVFNVDSDYCQFYTQGGTFPSSPSEATSSIPLTSLISLTDVATHSSNNSDPHGVPFLSTHSYSDPHESYRHESRVIRTVRSCSEMVEKRFDDRISEYSPLNRSESVSERIVKHRRNQSGQTIPSMYPGSRDTSQEKSLSSGYDYPSSRRMSHASSNHANATTPRNETGPIHPIQPYQPPSNKRRRSLQDGPKAMPITPYHQSSHSQKRSLFPTKTRTPNHSENHQNHHRSHPDTPSSSVYPPTNHLSSSSRRISRIYTLIKQYPSGLPISHLNDLFATSYHETLPSNTQLLKFLVDLPKILLINRFIDREMMLFYSDTPSLNLIQAILSRKKSHCDSSSSSSSSGRNEIHDEGMTIHEFKKEMQAQIGRSLEDCDLFDFLKRYPIVEIIERDLQNPANNLVRLIPKAGFTVLLGNLKPEYTQRQIHLVLASINPKWKNNRMRMIRKGGALNTYVDFDSLNEAETAMTQIKRSEFYTPEMRVEIESTSAQWTLKERQTDDSFPVLTSPPNPRNQRWHSLDYHPAARLLEPASFSSSSLSSSSSSTSAIPTTATARSPLSSPAFSLVPRHRTARTPRRHRFHRDRSPSRPLNVSDFASTTKQIYTLIRENGGKMGMSHVARAYQRRFHETLEFDGNPKYFVKMERLLLLNCKTTDDVMVFYTPEPASKLVVSILKRNTSYPNGIPVSEFKRQLEERMRMSLIGCDFDDFLMRWRFLSIREDPMGGEKTVQFTPNSGYTVFFGNLRVGCTEDDIYQDLIKFDPSWANSRVRLKMGRGFSYAFVDFPTRSDAIRAVNRFDDRPAFGSKNVSADIDGIEQRKRNGNETGGGGGGGGIPSSYQNHGSPCPSCTHGHHQSHPSPSSQPIPFFVSPSRSAYHQNPSETGPNRRIINYSDPLHHSHDRIHSFPASQVSSPCPSSSHHHPSCVGILSNHHRHNPPHPPPKYSNGHGHRSLSCPDESANEQRWNPMPGQMNCHDSCMQHEHHHHHSGHATNGCSPLAGLTSSVHHHVFHHHSLPLSSSPGRSKSIPPSSQRITVYLGNLRDDVTKQQIQKALGEIDPSWAHLTVRLNLRSGWSHAFVDFDESGPSKYLIALWNNRPHSLTMTRLRCEISKRQM